MFFFFFQAEDGIRDYKVTGVQTCALPISLTEANSSMAPSITNTPTNVNMTISYVSLREAAEVGMLRLCGGGFAGPRLTPAHPKEAGPADAQCGHASRPAVRSRSVPASVRHAHSPRLRHRRSSAPVT